MTTWAGFWIGLGIVLAFGDLGPCIEKGLKERKQPIMKVTIEEKKGEGNA